MPPRPHWHIFCTVIDNYGDAGVCWRLARQLVAEYGLAVTLWIDRPEVLARLWPALDARRAEQCLAGVRVRRWDAGARLDADAAVVIEAFACTLPAAVMADMASRQPPPRWFNLEYLSAETWVEGCHGLPSTDPRTGLKKTFFFPGFTAATGGLLRERDLALQRQAFLAGDGRMAFLRSLGVPALPQALTLSLFAYPQAPVADLLRALADDTRPSLCLLAAGPGQAAAGEFFGGPDWPVGALRQRGNVQALLLPFLDQDAYDRLLWSCEINFVRGEDSFLRAQWAARPLIWQAYPQDGAAHLLKLEAWLARYRIGLPQPVADALTAFHQGWNSGHLPAAAWPALCAALPALQRHAGGWCDRLSAQPDLACRLAQAGANSL